MQLDCRNSSDVLVPVSPTNPAPVVLVTAGAAANKCTFVRGYKNPADAGTPEKLIATATYVTTVTIYGIKAARTANAGTVYIDSIATNDAQANELASSGILQFTAPPGKVIDLSELYVDIVTAGDGVFFFGML